MTSVAIPAGLGQIESYTFQNCTGLTSVTIPAGITNVGDAAFEGCSALTAIAIPSTVKAMVSSSFGGCVNLASISIAAGNPVYSSNGNCIIETYEEVKQKETIIHVKLVSGCKSSVIPDGVTEIGTAAFQNCTGLTSIDIPLL